MCVDLQRAVQLNNDGVNALVNDNEDVAITLMADSLKVLQDDMANKEAAAQGGTGDQQTHKSQQQQLESSTPPGSPHEPTPPLCHPGVGSFSPATLNCLSQNPFVKLSKRHHVLSHGDSGRQQQPLHLLQQPPPSSQVGNPCILLFERAVLIPDSSSFSQQLGESQGSSKDDPNAASLAIIQLKDVLVSTLCVLFNVALAHHRKGKKLIAQRRQQELQPLQQQDDKFDGSLDEDGMETDEAEGSDDSADECILKAEKLYRVVLGTDLLATTTISQTTSRTVGGGYHNCSMDNLHSTAIALIVKLACINNLLEIRPDRGMHDLAFEGLVTDVITLLQTSRVVSDHPLFQNPQIQYLLLNVFLLQEFGPHIAPGAA